MQEEVEQKTFNIVVSTTKLTARTILNAGKAALGAGSVPHRL